MNKSTEVARNKQILALKKNQKDFHSKKGVWTGTGVIPFSTNFIIAYP
jgi:hypothetical protein